MVGGMKLVIEHQPHQRMTANQPLEYAVYLDGTGDVRDVMHPLIRFGTETEARRYCELFQQGRWIAEYEI